MSDLTLNSGNHQSHSDYKLDLNAAHGITYSDVENSAINGLGIGNANFQQYISEPNMFDPSNAVAASYGSDIKGSDSNEKENCDAYLIFSNVNYLFQNLEPPNADLLMNMMVYPPSLSRFADAGGLTGSTPAEVSQVNSKSYNPEELPRQITLPNLIL
ncbi:hypothetical protein HAX54_018069 [Datura stramonium]|uniref:Uncharacterized protein n=1 Tax=Datura stramonium TaxID=4076 RepID=A0ABS8S1S8_DATST|nr:hypothetical protein [Datura stramonium]